MDKILLPRLIILKEVLNGNSDLTPKQQQEKVLFELSVVAQLVGTLENNKGLFCHFILVFFKVLFCFLKTFNG